MKHLVRISSLFLIVFMISLFITIPVLAIPPLPSSFYGTVKVNGANVPDGTLIQAIIGGQVYAEGFTQTYQGDSVFALDVRGDDTETAAQDGGREGDAIQFKVGGALASQAAVWHAGTNVNLNLAASSSGTISTPQATPTPVPTQTAIVLIQPSSMPTAIAQASSTPTVLIQPSQAATQSSNPSPMPGAPVQASPTPVISENDQDAGSGNLSPVVLIIILVLTIMIGYIFLVLRKKNM